MKTLHNITQGVLTLAWIVAAIAILPIGIVGIFTLNTKLFLIAWICAIALLVIPMISHLVRGVFKKNIIN